MKHYYHYPLTSNCITICNPIKTIETLLNNEHKLDVLPLMSKTSIYTTNRKKNLSIAIVHVLSMNSVAASNATGQANAVKRPCKTVIIAPCLISSVAIPKAKHSNIGTNRIHPYSYTTQKYQQPGTQTNYLI